MPGDNADQMTNATKSNECVYATLRREPAGRISVFMWFHPDTCVRLASVLSRTELIEGGLP